MRANVLRMAAKKSGGRQQHIPRATVDAIKDAGKTTVIACGRCSASAVPCIHPLNRTLNDTSPKCPTVQRYLWYGSPWEIFWER